MIQIIVQAQKASCRKSSGERITTGMVGKKVTFDFSAEWDGLVKTAVFEGSGTAKVVVMNEASAEIPHECLTVPGGMLSVGVFGTDGTIQTPTVYTDIGQIEQGADPSGDTSADPTLPIWAQLQAMMGDLGNLTTTAKNNLVEAINEAAKSGGTADDVKMQVADGYVQYSSDGGMTWTNLIAMADLKGGPGEPGKDGHSPVVTATKSGKTTTISVDGAAIATVEDGADGKPGTDGADGVTPHIGDNGNWYLGETDTGKPSRGADGATGATGATGEKGADGKSAYAYAVEGGYTGTEAEFAAKLAADKLPNPNALTFTGAVTGSYDGSAPLEVAIPSGGGSGGSASVSIEQVYTWTADGTVMSNLDTLAIEPGKLYIAEFRVPENWDLSANVSVPVVDVRIGTSGANTYEGSLIGNITGQQKVLASLTKYIFFVSDGEIHIISDRTQNAQNVPNIAAYKGDNVYICSRTKDTPILSGTTLKIYKLG